MQNFLIIAGSALLMIGLLWPWIEKLGLGRLPSDIAVEKEGLGFYCPLMTSIIISIETFVRAYFPLQLRYK